MSHIIGQLDAFASELDTHRIRTSDVLDGELHREKMLVEEARVIEQKMGVLKEKNANNTNSTKGGGDWQCQETRARTLEENRRVLAEQIRQSDTAALELRQKIKRAEKEIQDAEEERTDRTRVMVSFFNLYRSNLGLDLKAVPGGIRTTFSWTGVEREGCVELHIRDNQYTVSSTQPYIETADLVNQVNRDLKLKAFFVELRARLHARIQADSEVTVGIPADNLSSAPSFG